MFKKFGEISETLIDDYQKIVKMELPQDYKKFLLETNGGVFEEKIHSFILEELKEDIGVDVLFGLQQVRSLDLEAWFDEYSDELLENTIVIGNTISAGLILLIWQDDWKGVFLWDHCLELEQSTEEDCLYKIADDFETFWGEIA